MIHGNEDDITDDEDFAELMWIVAFPRRRRRFRNRIDHFEFWNNDEFFDCFRLSKATIRYVLDLIGDKIALATDK